jgi:hypothetical protein
LQADYAGFLCARTSMRAEQGRRHVGVDFYDLLIEAILQSCMECETCRRLQGEVSRMERAHAERLGELRSQTHWVHRDEYHRLLTAETNAKNAVNYARKQLENHKLIHTT